MAADRNRELVPDNWSLVRGRALTTGLCSEGWYSEHSGVCRRAELPGGSVKVKKKMMMMMMMMMMTMTTTTTAATTTMMMMLSS